MSGSSAVDIIERPVLPALPPGIRSKKAIAVPPPPVEPAVDVPPVEPVVDVAPVEPVVDVAPVEPAVEVPRSPMASQNHTEQLGPVGATKSMPSGKKKGLFILVGIVAVALIAAGLFVSRTFANTTLVTNLETGQCVEEFFSSVDGEFREVFLVGTTDCSTPHAYEVYSTNAGIYAPGAYPGIEEVFAIGQDYCRGEYDNFVGGDFETSSWDVWTFVPTEARWRDSDREVQCLVGDFNQVTLTTGTLEGAGR